MVSILLASSNSLAQEACDSALTIRKAHAAVVCVEGLPSSVERRFNARLAPLAEEFGPLEVGQVTITGASGNYLLLCASVKPKELPPRNSADGNGLDNF